METTPSPGPCPRCGATFEMGYLGFGSGLFWSRERLRGARSLFFLAGAFGEWVVGSFLSTPWLRSREAHRCSGCGALLIPTDH